MHEIKIAKELSEIVLDVAVREKLLKVTRVNISFGQMIQIVPDIFDFAFRVTVKGTIAEDAEVSVEIVPVRLCCRKCKNEFITEEYNFLCNKCDSSEIDIINGKEIFVKSIEGE